MVYKCSSPSSSLLIAGRMTVSLLTTELYATTNTFSYAIRSKNTSKNVSCGCNVIALVINPSGFLLYTL